MSNDNIISLVERLKQRETSTSQTSTSQSPSKLSENKKRVLRILTESSLKNLLDFSSPACLDVIDNADVFLKKETLTSADVKDILSYGHNKPNSEISYLILGTDAFSRIVRALTVNDFAASSEYDKPISDNEVRIDKLNEFEMACHKAIWLYNEGEHPGKTLAKELLRRNILSRISQGIGRSDSEHIDVKMYLKTKERINRGEKVYIETRRKSFIVTIKDP